MNAAFNLCPAGPADSTALGWLLNNQNFYHRHLDWRPALDWLGSQPFWIIENPENSNLVAALAAPVDPPGVAWVHLFASSPQLGAETAWRMLLEPVERELFSGENPIQFVSLSFHERFSQMLAGSGFTHRQDIISYERIEYTASLRPQVTAGLLRPMKLGDLPAVLRLDQIAFESIWVQSGPMLAEAFKQSAYATVIEAEDDIIAYQISTSTPFAAHLARLAVHPRWRRARLGRQMVEDMLYEFALEDIHRVTVNTQSDNLASRALYEQIGFTLTGEALPVFIKAKTS